MRDFLKHVAVWEQSHLLFRLWGYISFFRAFSGLYVQKVRCIGLVFKVWCYRQKLTLMLRKGEHNTRLTCGIYSP